MCACTCSDVPRRQMVPRIQAVETDEGIYQTAEALNTVINLNAKYNKYIYYRRHLSRLKSNRAIHTIVFHNVHMNIWIALSSAERAILRDIDDNLQPAKLLCLLVIAALACTDHSELHVYIGMPSWHQVRVQYLLTLRSNGKSDGWTQWYRIYLDSFFLDFCKHRWVLL